MATAPIKSPPFHNFNFPFLKWGTHTDCCSSPEHESDHGRLRPGRVGSRSSRIHRSSFSTPPKSIKQSNNQEEEITEGKIEAEEEETIQRTWNLRPRKAMIETATVLTTAATEKASETMSVKSVRLRGLAEHGEKKERRKFWIALSREEIEEDIFALTGSRPNRRPKKRPKTIQKQLDAVFPGLWLVGSTADDYRAADSSHKK